MEDKVLKELYGLIDYFGNAENALCYIKGLKTPHSQKRGKKQVISYLQKYIVFTEKRGVKNVR